ncbi:MAG: DUF805 domain-containing protein [Actinobacteria bacterium]|nr:DUF805 domain-containing protein [Actinomycetota bacterium]
MVEAIQEGFNKYWIFTGRATRPQYWYFYFFCILVNVGSGYIGSALITDVTSLILFVPLLAAGVRRMHDVDKSGWFLLIPIYNIVLLCTRGTGMNRFDVPVL